MAANAQQALRTLFQTGALSAGEALDLDDIARRLSLDVDDIRGEAAKLEAFGLLEQEADYYVVRSLTPEAIVQFVEMRLDIEVRVAETLARTASSDDIADLRLENEVLRSAALRDERVRFMEVSARFHQLLAERANFLQGARMLQTWEDFQQIVGARALERPEAMLQAIVEHESLIDFIQLGESEQAGKAMREHLQHTLERARDAVAA